MNKNLSTLIDQTISALQEFQSDLQYTLNNIDHEEESNEEKISELEDRISIIEDAITHLEEVN